MISRIMIVVVLASCVAEPSTFPDRIGDGRSPRTGGVACHSMAGYTLGCTDWDGHHTIDIGTLGIFKEHVFLSDLGPTWGTIGPWHTITQQQAAIWCEARCGGAIP